MKGSISNSIIIFIGGVWLGAWGLYGILLMMGAFNGS